MPRFRVTLIGTRPLLMHNTQLADPQNRVAAEMRAINKKRANRTEDDYAKLAELEFTGGLYYHQTFGPYVPALNIERCLVDGARKATDGKKIEQGVEFDTDVNPLGYDGPRDIASLWADPAFHLMAPVRVSGSRIMRCRPRFEKWKVDADGTFDHSVIDLAVIRRAIETAGQLLGLGDWRPRYGRFTGTVEEIT